MANHQYKDSVFRMLFNDPVELAKLYKAIRDTDEDILPEDLKITTLNDILLDSVKNDLSFEWKDEAIVLMEHQSTWNENMPARMLSYASRLMDKTYEVHDAIYKSELITLPEPHFYTFYMGEKPPRKKVLRLSDAFRGKCKDLELVCHVIDISYSRGKQFLDKCEPLEEYSFFINRSAGSKKSGMTLDEATHEAIAYCKKHQILMQVLNRYEEEVIDVVSLRWNADDAKKFAEKDKKAAVAEATAKTEQRVREGMILNMLRKHFSVDSIIEAVNGTSEEILAIAKKNGLAVQ